MRIPNFNFNYHKLVITSFNMIPLQTENKDIGL